MATDILDLENSNTKIINLIQSNRVFSIIRLGIGSETYMTYEYDIKHVINENFLHPTYKTLYNAGIYTKNKDISKMELYAKFYSQSIKNSDIIACFNTSNMNIIQQYYINKYTLESIYSRTLEPFYQIQENIKPWTHYLLGKKVLIINPFIDSFKKQLNNNFQIFTDADKKIFLDGQEFIFYKSFQTIAGNHVHNDWFETFCIMCKDISKLDFDIALLGCGGYGLPLCNYIKTKLNRSAIYIGGGLQLLFGVFGKRWENNDMWKKIIKDNDTKFIYPSGDELCNNLNTIEGGCYW
jgi:hypothetical protein